MRICVCAVACSCARSGSPELLAELPGLAAHVAGQLVEVDSRLSRVRVPRRLHLQEGRTTFLHEQSVLTTRVPTLG